MALEFTSVYLNEVYIPRVVNTATYQKSFFLRSGVFEVIPEAQCVSGSEINQIFDYTVSTNAAAYTRGDPMVDAFTMSSIRGYHNKDSYQESAKVYGIDKAYMNGQGAPNVPISPDQKSLDQGIANIVDAMEAVFLTDLAAQVDSSTAYGDGSLTKATYGLVSYESAVGGALTENALEDMIEALHDTTYGYVNDADMVFLCAANQKTNFARLTAGAQYKEVSWDASNPWGDAGRLIRARTYNDIPIIVVPGMTSTEWYLVDRTKIKIHYWHTINAQPKNPEEWADLWLLVGGANLVCEDPKRTGKLTGVTA